MFAGARRARGGRAAGCPGNDRRACPAVAGGSARAGLGERIMAADKGGSSSRPLRWLGLLLLAALIAAAAAPAGARAQTGPFQIEMIVFRGCEEACEGFRDMLRSSGIDHALRIHDAETDAARIPGFVAEIRDRRPDLVVTWGTTTALTVFGRHDAVDPERHIVDIPGIFMIVSQPVESGIVPTLESSGRNITGTSYLVPETQQLEAALSYLSFRRLGILYNPAETNSVINVALMRKAAAEVGVEVVAWPVPDGADGRPDPAAIAPLVARLAEAGIDLVYQGADSFLNINRRILTEAAVENGLPVFAAGQSSIYSGSALMSVANEYYVVGQLTALRAIDVLRGAKPESIPIRAPARFTFLVNIPIVHRLGLYPPMTVIRVARFVEPDGK